MIHKQRLAARLDGDFVVFLIGMRINQPLKIHKWWPAAMAMPQMIKELYAKPELGFLHGEAWFGRTTIMVQYWRSMDQLLAYAKNRDAEHLPAWRAFNQAVGLNGSVGVWHESYLASAGTYENIYVNMPPFGLGRAGEVYEASGKRQTAAERLRASTNVEHD